MSLKFISSLSFSLLLQSATSTGFYPLCGLGTASSPCILQPGTNGLMLAVPYTSTNETIINDWQPFNCQYNGQMHLSPHGISSTDGSTAVCNPDYLKYSLVPDGSGEIALRGNMYAGDFAKDNSDLAQQGQGFKCPATRLASGSNYIGEWTYVMPQGFLYTVSFSIMITEVHTGFLFSIHEIQGPNVRIVFMSADVNGVEGFYLGIVQPTDEAIPLIANSTLGPLIYAITAAELSNPSNPKWLDFTLEYCAGCAGYSSGSGYANVTLSIGGEIVGESGIWPLQGASDGFNIKYGVTTLNPNCATADFTFFLKNVLIYQGSSIPSSAASDLANFVTPLPPWTGATATGTYPVNQYAVYPAFVTSEPDTAGFNPSGPFTSYTPPTTSNTATGSSQSPSDVTNINNPSVVGISSVVVEKSLPSSSSSIFLFASVAVGLVFVVYFGREI